MIEQVDADVAPEIWDEAEQSLQIALSNVRDPEVMRRAAEEMDQLREEVFQREGLLDITLPTLREIRNGE